MPNNKAEFQALLRRLAAPDRTPTWHDAPWLEPGTLVGDAYVVVRLASRGGMGEVYEARDAEGLPVAIKCLLPALAADPRAALRFAREASVVAALEHRHIVRQLGAGRLSDGRPYLAMEWMSDGTLAELLARVNVLSVRDGLALAEALSAALASAHAHGVVHRDIKPSNIFLGDAASPLAVKLGDFGIAKLRADALPGLTTTGTALGSPHYMAPEQIEGNCTVDTRTDVYALGIVLYQALSGLLPYRGRTHGELALAICAGDAAPLSTVRPAIPAALCALVARAMARQPAGRFADMGAFSTALCRIDGARSEGLL